MCDRIASGEGGYVTFCNVHLTVTARKDTRLRDIINNSFMSMPAARFVFHQPGGLPALGELALLAQCVVILSDSEESSPSWEQTTIQ